MASQFVVEFTEKGQRKQENAIIGIFDGSKEEAEETIRRIWAGALPDRTDVKVISVVGAGTIRRAPAISSTLTPTSGDNAYIAEKLKATGDLK